MKKKLLVLLSLTLIFTGCGKKEKETTKETVLNCSSNTSVVQIRTEENYDIEYDGKNVKKVTIVDNYTRLEADEEYFTQYVSALKEQMENNKKINGFTMNVVEENKKNFKVKYTVEVQNMSESDLETLGFRLNKDLEITKNNLTAYGMSCK